MIVLAISYPALGFGTVGLILWTGIFWIVLLSLMYLPSFNRPVLHLAWKALTGLAGASCAAIIWCYTFRSTGHGWIFVALNVLTLMFLCAAGGSLAHSLFLTRRVTSDHLVGAACFYILLGLVWTYIYHIIYATGNGDLGLSKGLSPALRHAEFLYYSFVTLSTVGYGDIVPKTLWMRVASATESIVGQVFLAVLVARSVGLNLVAARDQSRTGSD